MKKITTITLAAAMLGTLSTSALAIEAMKTTTINAPVATVWKKIGGWCAIKDWHPAVADCKEMRDGDALRRVLTLGDGAEIKELLVGENENSYTYTIESGPLPVKNYKSTLSVTAQGDDKTKVTWIGRFNGEGKTDEEAAEIMSGVYAGGLEALAKEMNK